MNAVTRKAPAKINLGLDIVGRRADGYHLLETVFQTVSVYDCLTVSHRTQAGISLTCSVKNVPCDATNLVWKAAEAFCRAAEITPQFHIDLEKHIPSQAGMGGGSTDAAAVLQALQELTGVTLPQEQLLQIAVKLGADVPFFLYGGTAYAAGIGEALEQLPACALPYLVIAKGNEGVSTPAAYRAVDALVCPKHPPVQKLREALIAGAGVQEIAPLCGNLFESAVALPEVTAIRQQMLASGALCSVMTGSGAAVFGIFDGQEQAELACAALRNVVPFAVCCHAATE